MARSLGLKAPVYALLWLPKGYVDLRRVAGSFNWESWARSKTIVFVRFQAIDAPTLSSTSGRSYSIRGLVGNSAVTVRLFGTLEKTPWKNMRRGDAIHLRGVVSFNGDRITLLSPEIIAESEIGTVRAEYPNVRGKPDDTSLSNLIGFALDNDIEDAPAILRSAFGGMPEVDILRVARVRAESYRQLLVQLHRPTSPKAGERAREDAKRLAIQYIHDHAAAAVQRRPLAPQLAMNDAQREKWANTLTVPLTPDQLNALQVIANDLKSGRPARIIVSGDPQTTPDMVGFITAITAQECGACVAIIASDHAQVSHIFQHIGRQFPQVPILAITRGMGLTSVALTRNPILVGTLSMGSALAPHGWAPNVLIIDEWNSVSKEQLRPYLTSQTHLLAVTTTPYAPIDVMVELAGFDVLTLTRNATKGFITTRVERSLADIAAPETLRAASGNSPTPVLVVYPADAALPDVSVKTQSSPAVTPATPPTALDEDLRIFGSNSYRIIPANIDSASKLVSSELGAIYILNAERYRLETLHRLRGRLAAVNADALFVLISSPGVSKEGIERLTLLEQHRTGFDLATALANANGIEIVPLKRIGEEIPATLFYGTRLYPADLGLA